ncbi:MAG TPA: carbamoyltransferase HypF [Motilibacterales bacterium]|nr:carbamoyltransferase HypF [Motilibacterales bacterium]
MSDPVRRRMRVTGVVQGVGFRPFVHGLATELGLSGFVGNDADGVFLEAQGPAGAVAELERRLVEQAPPLAVVDRVDVVPLEPTMAGPGSGPRSGAGLEPTVAGPTFHIAASGTRPGVTSIPPDTAVCDACLAEMRDPADRRHGHAFIACTHCGPRFTITTGLPYDRESTTMAGFPLCPACLAEYTDPPSRRFHAQPTACPECGPSLSMTVAGVVEALVAGRIVAVKGIGGYHLACDARNAGSVATLRARKQRGAKPFALMAADVGSARRVAVVDPVAEALLTSPARPVVILPALDDALIAEVAPGTGTLGVMLPYAPLHHLLFDAGAPSLLVMTSGNLAEEPICIDPAEAETRLAGLADVFCHHDRPIHVSCDDSVTRVVAGAPQPVRRSRGHAPMPLALPLAGPPMVAVGGELKSTVCVARGSTAWLSQHVGDTANLETLAMLARTVETLCALQQVTPEVMVSDAHPGYLSSRWAGEQAAARGIAHLRVGHHHAHLASLLAEHRMPAGEPVLGVVLDGTGYGADGTIWGGELLLGSYASVERVGHLRAIALPGGDAAIRHPARTAAAHLHAAGLDWVGTASADATAPDAGVLLARMLATGSHCTPTTSMGRLFDAISSLLDVRHEVTYEAQAAIELEALAASTTQEAPGWRPPGSPLGPTVHTDADGMVLLDPSGWIARAVADHAAGVDPALSARAFHLALADALTEAVLLVRDRHGIATVGLTGGVFANAVLSSACQVSLGGAGLRVLVHGVVPPNDGGLALGQAAVAAAWSAR